MYNVRKRIKARTGVARTSSIQVTTIQRKGRGRASRARASGTARIRLATNATAPIWSVTSRPSRMNRHTLTSPNGPQRRSDRTPVATSTSTMAMSAASPR